MENIFIEIEGKQILVGGDLFREMEARRKYFGNIPYRVAVKNDLSYPLSYPLDNNLEIEEWIPVKFVSWGWVKKE